MPCAPGNDCCPDCRFHGLPCEDRVEAQGRTLAQPCGPSGVCGPVDVLRWREAAQAWIDGAASAVRGPGDVERVNQLRWMLANVMGTPSSMVEHYARIAGSASCQMAAFIAAAQKQPPLPPLFPVPSPPADPGTTWPGLPGFPGFGDPNLLLVALLLFMGGWLTGEIFEEL